jgi:RHS repeat-associated protein
LYHEDWYVSLFGAPATSFDRVVYFYDPQGRVQYQYSPTNLPGQNYNGLNLTYGYDPYVGTVSSLSFSVGGTLWAASARNDLGQITTETMMSFGSNTSMTRTTGYYLPTGQVNTQTLTGSGGQQAQESYAYYSNGLPSQLAVSGVSGSWSETFNYDDLLRLTNWTPATGAPSVTYQYDSDGNLGQRQWSGETVNYAATPSARTSTVIQNGVTVSVDNYQIDLWGRIFDTPVTMVTYNANDEVTGIIEKTKGNQTDAVIRDGLGQRLATTYGASSYLVTLMNGMYEFKYNSSNGTYEERTRFAANGKLIGDQIKTANTARDTTTFYLTNNVGSVIAEASDTGVVTLRSRRDPYGNLLTNGTTPYLGADPTGSDPDGSSRLGYGGHERDPNSGLVDMNARFYSPRLGIFISPDSVIAHPFERRDYNPFAYVWDNPVAHNDPSGHDLGCGYLDWVLDNERGTVNSDGSIPVAPGVSMSTDANDHGITATSSTVDGMPAVDAVVSGADLMSPANAPEDSTVGVDATGAPQYQSRPDYETTVYGHPDPAPVNTAGQDAGNGGGGGHQYVGAVKIAKVLRTAGEVLSNLSPAGTKPGETEALGEVMSRADDVIAEGFEGVAQSIDNLTDRIDDLADRVNQVGSAISSAFSIDADPNFTSATGEPTYVPPRQ